MFDNEQNKYVDLESKVYIKYLGLLIDKNLSWKHHIDSIATKISKNVGLIAKLRYYVPRKILLGTFMFKTLDWKCKGVLSLDLG